MSNLTASSPLMQPVDYNGQIYFTSQYFHAQYLVNSEGAQKKYVRHHDFLRLLRSIEAYDKYLQRGDIVELSYNRQVDSLKHFLLQLYKSTGYKPITLLNASGQAAMSHHLDDEISKQLSAAINKTAGRQASQKADLLPIELADRTAAAGFRLLGRFSIPRHTVEQEVVKLIEKETGLNFRHLLTVSSAQNGVPADEKMLEPTDLATEMGWGKNQGAKMNKALEALGWQIKTISGDWEPTPLGSSYAAPHSWTARVGTKTGYNQKWCVEAVRQALIAGDEQANN